MPNIGALLKQEIVRLARKESRAEVEATKKASAQHRRHIAELRRQVTTLEHQVAVLQRSALNRPQAAETKVGPQRLRFVAKGLKSQRTRLGLSAADYGKLVGVSAQSVYNWEQGNANPRPEQLKMIAAVRAISKREAQARLVQSGTRRSRKSELS
jgi:DNA-binding transcriptional regulator YiaG